MHNLEITTLEKGWHDKDNVLLHACFQLLTDFMEKEKPGQMIDYNWDSAHRKVWKELNSLYKWWTEIRPNRKDPYDLIEKNPIPRPQREEMGGPEVQKKYKRYYSLLNKAGEIEKKWLEEDQKNLHRLIEIRSHLWT